jgi:hypothetical protein
MNNAVATIAEEPYVFHNADVHRSQYEPEISERLQVIMAPAWGTVAETGNPKTTGYARNGGRRSRPTSLPDHACLTAHVRFGPTTITIWSVWKRLLRVRALRQRYYWPQFFRGISTG